MINKNDVCHGSVSEGITSPNKKVVSEQRRGLLPTQLALTPFSDIPYRGVYLLLCTSLTTITILLSLSLTSCSHAAVVGTPFPSSINSGTFVQEDGTIPTGSGTTLNVVDMLEDAKINLLVESVFIATRPTFNGTLKIRLPESSSLWADSSIPIRILVQDGISNNNKNEPLLLGVFIEVSGVLSLGGSIAITGGSYTCTSAFIHLPNSVPGRGLVIESNSNFIVSGIAFDIAVSVTLYLIHHYGTNLTIHTNSTLSFTNNTIDGSNNLMRDTLPASWKIVSLISPVFIHTNGIFSLSENRVVVSNLSTGGFQWSIVYTDAVTMSTNSTFSISDNVVVVSDWSLGGSAIISVINIQSGKLDITKDSTLAVSNNSLSVENVTSSSQFYLVILLSSAPITITANSVVTVSSGDVGVVSLSTGMGMGCNLFTLNLLQATEIADSSALVVSANKLSVENLDIGGSFNWVLLFASSTSSISSSSTISISNNEFALVNLIKTSASLTNVLAASKTISIDASATVIISENNIRVANSNFLASWRLVIFNLATTVTNPNIITNNSTFIISGNRLDISNVTVVTKWEYGAMRGGSLTPLQVNTFSALSITNNTIMATDVIVQECEWTLLFAQIDIHSSGTATVSYNILSLSNVNTSGSGSFYLYGSSNPVAITDISLFAIFNNRMEFHHNTHVATTTWLTAPVYVHSTTTLTIKDNSVFLVNGNTLVVTNVAVATWNLYSLFGICTITNNSTLIHNNASMVLSNVSTSDLWTMRWVVLRSHTISNDSTLTLCNNIMDVFNVRGSGGSSNWRFSKLYVISSSSISANSAISISNNILTVMDSLFVGGDLEWAIVSVVHTVHTNCSLSITNNIIAVSSTWIGGNWNLYLLSTATTVHTGSSIAITNNKVTVSDVTIGGVWLWYAFYINPASSTINTSGTIFVTNNEMKVVNTNVAGKCEVYIFYTLTTSVDIVVDGYDSVVSLSNNHVEMAGVVVSNFQFKIAVLPVQSLFKFLSNATLTVSNNKMIVTNTSATGTTPELEIVYVIPLSGVIEVGGKLNIEGNYLHYPVPGNNVHVLRIDSVSVVRSGGGGGGTVNLNNNILGGAIGSMIYLESADATTLPIHTCRNSINGSLCVLNAGSDIYSCALGPGLAGKVEECSTPTMSLTRSPLTPTVTPSHTSPSVTPSHTPTVTPPPSATSSRPKTPTETTQKTTSLTPHRPPTLSATAPKSTAPTSSKSNAFNPPTTPCPTTPSHPTCPSYANIIKLGNHTTTTGTAITAPVGCALERLLITIPYDTWSSNTPFYVSLRLTDELAPYFITNTSSLSSSMTTSLLPPSSNPSSLLQTPTATLFDSGSGGLWIVVRLDYIGSSLSSSSDRKVLVDVVLPVDRFNCAPTTSSSSSTLSVDVTLSAAPTLPSVIVTIINVAMGVAVINVLPSSVVRMGMMNKIVQMLKCSEFDPSEEVGFINNPFNWGVGMEEMQYYRGSVVLSLITMGIITVCMLCVLMSVRACLSSSVKTWAAAVETLRLPSLPLVAVLLLGEVCVSSAVSMLLYDSSTAIDILLSLIMMTPLLMYIGGYVYTTAISTRNIKVIEAPPPPPPPPPRRPGDKRRTLPNRLLLYAMEPTHDVVLLKTEEDDQDDTAVNVRDAMRERWLRCNFYFVADRRWALYGALEVVGGTLTNLLEGIPLTTTSRALCIARPACVMLITAVLLVLLIWKAPNAVRLQQWCSLFVMGGMLLTSGLATANATSPSDTLELTTGYIGVVVVSASMVLGFIDMAVMLLMYVPVLRGLFALTPRGLEPTIASSHERQNASGVSDKVTCLAPSSSPSPSSTSLKAPQRSLVSKYSRTWMTSRSSPRTKTRWTRPSPG